MEKIGFVLPDLVVESVLVEGFQILRRYPDKIDTILSCLSESYNEKKYGQNEINKLKEFFSKKEVAIVHAFSECNAHDLSISIQLTSDIEMENRALLSDYAGKVTEGLGENQYSSTAPITAQSLIIVDNLVPSSFNSLTGAINIMAGDLSEVQSDLHFQDASGVKHKILGVDDSNSVIFVEPGSDVDVSDFGQVVSQITSRDFEVHSTREKQSLILGVHSKNRLTALYLYVIVKYILNAKRVDLHKRGFELPQYSGSDFTRDLSHLADVVHTRFITVTGQVCESWVDILGPLEQAEIIDVGLLVDKDVAGNEELGLTKSTVQVADEE